MEFQKPRRLFLSAKSKVHFKALCKELVERLKEDFRDKPTNDFGGWPSHKFDGFPNFLRSVDCFLSRPSYLDREGYFAYTIQKHIIGDQALSQEDVQSVKVLCVQEILKAYPDDLDYEDQLHAAAEDEVRAANVVASIVKALENPRIAIKLKELLLNSEGGK